MKRKPSLMYTLVIAVVLVILGTLMLSVGLFSNSMKNTLSDAFRERVHTSAEQVGSRVTETLRAATHTVEYLSGALPNSDDPSRYADILAAACETGELAGCTLLSLDGKAVCPDVKPLARTSGTAWFSLLSHQTDGFAYSLPHVQTLYDGKYPWVMSIGKRVPLPDSFSAGKEGVLVVDVRLSPLMEMCKSALLGESGYLYMVSEEGEIIFHPEQQLLNLSLINEDIDMALSMPPGQLYTEAREDGERMILPMTIAQTNWRLIGVASARDADNEYDALFSRLLTLTALALACALVVTVLLSLGVTRPLRRIEKTMHDVEDGDMARTLPPQPFSELSSLARAFNNMIGRIRALMQEAESRQKQLRNAELGALQAQIKPHFLYNTLDSVIRLLETGRQSDAVLMVESLAKLLRISISQREPVIALSEELMHARCYLNIQQIRYRQRFTFDIECEEGVAERPCLKLIVQPLVENAIKHGVGELTGCHIHVRAFSDDGKLRITVSDDGMGVAPERLMQIRQDIECVAPSGKTGVGLANIHQRIRLMYGEDYGLTIESEAEVCTLISVTLP